jgi:hypothetical protein
VKGDAPLKRCPYCGGRWPLDTNHSLRRLAFLDDLPRSITPMNIDGLVVIHDGQSIPERFVFIEVKLPHERLPEGGQLWALRGLARVRNHLVYIVHGQSSGFRWYQVLPDGRLAGDMVATGAQLRHAIECWLENGDRKAA